MEQAALPDTLSSLDLLLRLGGATLLGLFSVEARHVWVSPDLTPLPF
jgi:hypothetical protein